MEKTAERGWRMSSLPLAVQIDEGRFRSLATTQPLDPSSCHLGNGHPPACSQTLQLGTTLDRFRREAVWRRFDTGRYDCPYMIWGKGPALMFVPGLCDDPWSFIFPMARLSEHFCCIAYSMPTGEGDGAPLARYRHADLVADLLGLLDHLHIREAHLLGCSFGSTVALAALHAQPERFVRTILQGGFARRPLAPAEVLLASWARWWPGRLRHLPLRRLILRDSLAASFARRAPEVWQYYIDHDDALPIAAVAYRALLLHQVDLRPLLPKIRRPVLVLTGDCDPLVRRACAEELLRGLPNAAHAEIEDCGHLPQYTHPEVLCEVVKHFLKHCQS
jgi:pimeloyl-ACP methyl ester carboxylesterase